MANAELTDNARLVCNRESKYLQRMGVHVPEVACTLLLQEERFKFYFAQLSHLVGGVATSRLQCSCVVWLPLIFSIQPNSDIFYR